MRLTSEVWVSAFIRAAQAEGAFATVLRRGAREAGAIFVSHSRTDGGCSLYGPAPQTVFDEGDVAERKFECVAENATEADQREYLERQIKFDPDCWMVEIECGELPAMLTIADN